MTRRRTNKQKNTNSWVGRMILTLCMVLLIACFSTRKDPVSLLSDMYHYGMGNMDKITRNDSQWAHLVDVKNATIDSLHQHIFILKQRSVPPTARVVTKETDLNIRSQPSTTADIIGKIPDGANVQILYIDFEEAVIGVDRGNWVKIKYNEMIGFVFSTYLSL